MDPTIASRLARSPQLLRADNLTPPTRTPWGGTRIVDTYKSALAVAPPGTPVGESWEVSVEPSFPSRLAISDVTLAQVIAAAPEDWLGPEVAARHGGQTPLLVKLLDAAAPLSVQVHPATDDPALAEDESGKPEAWVILEADAGAGIYLGLRDNLTHADVARCLAENGRLDRMLNFVPVRPGDAFVIDAGTPHAIGPGVTLLEPQFVLPGRKGLTYRFWDWNRRYDANGKLSPDGEPRPLHMARSLAVTDWQAPRGQTFVDRCRGLPEVHKTGGLERCQLLRTAWCEIDRWRGAGRLEVKAPGTLTALVCVDGAAALGAGDSEQALVRGRSAVVPAAAGDLWLDGLGFDVFAVRSPLSTT